MKGAAKNFKSVVVAHAVMIFLLCLILMLLDRGPERTILAALTAGLILSLLLQFILFRFRPRIFRDRWKGENGGQPIAES